MKKRVTRLAVAIPIWGFKGKSDKLVGRRNQPESTGNGRNPNTIKTKTSQSQISRDEQSRRIPVQVQ